MDNISVERNHSGWPRSRHSSDQSTPLWSDQVQRYPFPSPETDVVWLQVVALSDSIRGTASGKLLIRVPPEVHSRALIKAQSMGKSLNQWATEALEHAVQVNG